MSTDRNVQRNGLINLMVFLGIGIAAAVAAQYVRSATAEVTALLVGFGFLVSLVSYLQMRLETQEQLEKLEFDELQKSKNASALFDTAEAENFPAQRSRIQFERFGVPVFSVVLMLAQAVAAYVLWVRYSNDYPGLTVDKAPIGMTFFGIFMLVQFLLGKFSAGIARLEKQRLMRPGSAYMLLCSFASLLSLTALIFAYLDSPRADVIIARALVIIMGLSAVETLFNVVFEAYRPRLKGQVTHLLYDSRVIGLVGDPAGFFSTAAQALDYQFGFKVSETWFYRFLQRTIAWIILAQIGILWLSTVVVFIEPGEQALLERFGKPVGSVLDPGPHFKLPWPMSKVYRYQTRAIQSFLVGVVPDENLEKEHVVLWTKAHYKEEVNMLVASRQQLTATNSNDTSTEAAVPVNLLTASIPVQYIISDLSKWAVNHEDAGELLEKLATREVVSYLVSVDLDEIMSSGRLKAAKDLQAMIQKTADQHELGVEIIFVGLQDIHPPVAVAEAYESVNAAMQARQGIIYTAEGEKAESLPRARAEAANIIADAEVYRLSEQAKGVAAVGRFPNQVIAYQASPEVFRQRSYLDTLGRAIAPARKYVIGVTNTTDTIIMNLEDKVRMDILDDVALPPPTPKQ